MAAEAGCCASSVRPFWHVLRAVSIYLLAIHRGAEARQVSVSASGTLDNEQLTASNRIIRTESDSRGTLSSRSVQRSESLLEHDSSAPGDGSVKQFEEDTGWNPKSATVGVQDHSQMYYGQVINLTTPAPPPTEFLLFNWDAGGAWDGERNDLDAEVGFEFTPTKNLNITALGRHVKGRFDQLDTGGKNLFNKANVSLWYVIPRGMKLDKDVDPNKALKLLSIEVGPGARREAGGTYNLQYLEKPYQVMAHQTYRLTQTCWRGMEDVWFDGVAKDTDIRQYALTECIKVGAGCHSDVPNTFPDKIEADHRRLGMLNMRVDTPDGCGLVAPENFKDEAAAKLR